MNSAQIAPALNLAPSMLVIFGITGDLSRRKLLPALYQLERNNLLHSKTRIVGITRREISIDDLFDKVPDSDMSETDIKVLQKLKKRIQIFQMNITTPTDYLGLKDYLDKIEAEVGQCTGRIFYLSIPPQISAPIIVNLGKQELNLGCGSHDTKSRLLLEKPFGFDTKTAQELIETTTKYFEEEQIYRIDHYLAKETVQNIVTFRFRNPIFEDIWNNQHIESIEIIADEKIDIEGRANFYEQTGALRDLIQSHLLHVMSVVMMDRPKNLLDEVDIHKSRLKLLSSIEQVPADKINKRAVRGQYEGYKNEVESRSTDVETFAALTLFSNDRNWKDVPIIIKTGKALKEKHTCITICFKPLAKDHDYFNRLHFYIQPNESIVIDLWVKKPGFNRVMQSTKMNFNYQQAFSDDSQPDAYERVLVDAIRGDHVLFASSEEVMQAWRIIQTVINAWEANGNDLAVYPKGSDGPDLSMLEGNKPYDTVSEISNIA